MSKNSILNNLEVDIDIVEDGDFSDSVSNISLGFRYFFIPPTVNG